MIPLMLTVYPFEFVPRPNSVNKNNMVCAFMSKETFSRSNSGHAVDLTTIWPSFKLKTECKKNCYNLGFFLLFYLRTYPYINVSIFVPHRVPTDSDMGSM